MIIIVVSTIAMIAWSETYRGRAVAIQADEDTAADTSMLEMVFSASTRVTDKEAQLAHLAAFEHRGVGDDTGEVPNLTIAEARNELADAKADYEMILELQDAYDKTNLFSAVLFSALFAALFWNLFWLAAGRRPASG